jgi:DNA recombination protein RmuC
MTATTLLLLLLAAGAGVLAGAAAVRRHRLPVPGASPNRAVESLSLDVLRTTIDDAIRHMGALVTTEHERAGEQLGHKKELIDTSLEEMRAQLLELTRVVGVVERDRQRSFGELTEQLRAQQQGVHELTTTTQQLREVLASAKTRGQWGERMADDVLRCCGLLEGVNYRKQSAAANGGIPDFTFFLPNGRLLHMDVKFPLDNYARFVAATGDLERRQHRDAFVKDVRNRVKELTARGYLDGDDTVDCLLLFIPNESVYAFVHEHDPRLLDLALEQQIVLCSPLTLYAVLAVVRQAVENFALERQAKEVLVLLGQFDQQWNKYADKLDKVQRSFNAVQKDYDELMTTRHRALARPLDKLAQLRRDQGLELVDDERLALEA